MSEIKPFTVRHPRSKQHLLADAPLPVKPVLPVFEGRAIKISMEAGEWLHSPASPLKVVKEYASVKA